MSALSDDLEALARRLLSRADPTVIPASRLTRRVDGSVRPHTMSRLEISGRSLDLGDALYPHDPELGTRPRTLGECEALGLGEAHKCPFVSCKWHLFLDVHPRRGSIKFNFPDRDVWELEETCALSVAARAPEVMGSKITEGAALSLEAAGDLINLNRERVRQFQMLAFAKLRGQLEDWR